MSGTAPGKSAGPAGGGRHWRGWLEVVAIIVLLEAGGVLGALSGFLPLSAIGSVLLPLLGATLFLHREGTPWRALAAGRPLSWKGVLGWTALAWVLCVLLTIPAQALLRALGIPPIDFRIFQALLEGNLMLYLWMLIPVSWGSAAIGEELLVRGFLQHRLEGLVGTAAAVLLQAVIFALAHFYQGLAGIINVFVVGLVFGVIYLRCGRNLLPLILAHGLIDTLAMTLFYLGEAELLMS
jgi:membrane protease YdiL (CAAX protease family)